MFGLQIGKNVLHIGKTYLHIGKTIAVKRT